MSTRGPRLRAIIFVLASISIIAGSVDASVIRPEHRDALIERLLGQFWGNAVNIRGEPIQPASEEDRRTVPVSQAVAYRALEAGEISGFAEWCGLDWEPHYFSITRAARAMKFEDKQVAFVSVLHGAAQGTFLNSMQGKECSAEARARAAARLIESGQRGLPGAAPGAP